jgi:hypothetical protein
MCTGLAKALAGTQFSGSPKTQGKFKQKIKTQKKGNNIKEILSCKERRK